MRIFIQALTLALLEVGFKGVLNWDAMFHRLTRDVRTREKMQINKQESRQTKRYHCLYGARLVYGPGHWILVYFVQYVLEMFVECFKFTMYACACEKQLSVVVFI